MHKNMHTSVKNSGFGILNYAVETSDRSGLGDARNQMIPAKAPLRQTEASWTDQDLPAELITQWGPNLISVDSGVSLGGRVVCSPADT